MKYYNKIWIIHVLLLVFFGVGSMIEISAKTFYVDPLIGGTTNDGSYGNPWKTLQEVIDSNKICTRQPVNFPYLWGQELKEKNTNAPVKSGDTILLRSGYHGIITISRMFNNDWITIGAQSGHTPMIHNLLIQAACKWLITGLSVSPEFGQSIQKVSLIDVESHNWSGPAREIVIENCVAYSALDVNAWDTNTWKTRACNGIEVSGRQIVIRNNLIKNVDFGISVSDDSVLIEGNEVNRFDGDGLRGVANDLTFRNNIVKNCIVARSANHDDGFQSWSLGSGGVGTGTVYRVKLIGNIIISNDDPSIPLKGALQGIGCFDGMFEDWDVINNVIITDHWHGISLYGARNCRVINNTVCDINTVSPGPPWILVRKHKNGTPAQNCQIRNNLTTSLTVDTGTGMIADHNIIIKNVSDFFVDYFNFDLRLKTGCIAIDSGSTILAPDIDKNGIRRPQGGAVDVGAYEYCSAQDIRHKMTSSSKHFQHYLISVNGSALRIINNNCSDRLRIQLLSLDGKIVRDFGIRQGGIILCKADMRLTGIFILQIHNGKNDFRQLLMVK